MSFESKVLAFSSRFVSTRSFELIVEPALADLEYEADASPLRNRIAVCRALAGALRIDIANEAGTFLLLSLVPACYYVVLLALWGTFFHMSGALSMFAWMIVVVSLSSVMLCFWPERRVVRPTE